MNLIEPLKYIEHLNLDNIWVNVLVLTLPLILGAVVAGLYFGLSLKKKRKEARQFSPIYSFDQKPANSILVRL